MFQMETGVIEGNGVSVESPTNGEQLTTNHKQSHKQDKRLSLHLVFSHMLEIHHHFPAASTNFLKRFRVDF